MIKKLFVLTSLAFLFGLLHCDSSVAQSGLTCPVPVYCSWYSLNSGCLPPLPTGATNCVPDGPWELACQIPGQCPPQAAADETCPTCGKAKPSAGAPISLASGNTYIQQSDIRIPGLGGGLTLARTWNSKWPSTQSSFSVGLFGPNWRSTYEERVFLGSDNYMKYARSDGSFWSFGYVSGGGVGTTYTAVAPANTVATLVYGSTNWTITFQNGEKRLFDLNSGWLTAIIDRNGNTTQLGYDSLNRLTTITDPASRHLNFSYPNGSSYLVTGVTSDVGVSLTYAYDAQNRLLTVTYPDQSTLTFQYDANSRISAVVDSNGKILESHTYDVNGRGLTSSRAGGVEAVTITYPH